MHLKFWQLTGNTFMEMNYYFERLRLLTFEFPKWRLFEIILFTRYISVKVNKANWLFDFVQSWLDFAFVGNYFIQVLVPLRTINRIIFQVSAIWDLTRFFNFHQVSKLAFSEKNWLILLLHSREAFCKCSNPTFGTQTKTFGSLGSNFEQKISHIRPQRLKIFPFGVSFT